MRVKATRVGNWEEAQKWLRTLMERAEKKAQIVIRDTLADGAKAAQAEIRSGAIKPPSKKKDGVTLIESGEYVDSIGVYKDKRTGNWYLGLPEGDHPSGVAWIDLWMWLRYGTATMPARPHIDTIFLQAIPPALYRHLRKHGFRLLTRRNKGALPR